MPHSSDKLSTTRTKSPGRHRRLHVEPLESRQLLAGLQLEKFTNGVPAESPPGPSVIIGDTVTWTYEVTNTTSTPVSEVLITDDNGTANTQFPTQTQRTLSVANRVDTVFDSKRGLLYISTTGGDVLRYDLLARQYLTPFRLTGSLRALDISPDQDTLVVANGTKDTTTNNIHVVDLRTGVSRQIHFTLDSANEAGTYSAVFTNNNTVLVTSNFSGSGWTPMRRVDLTTNTAVQVRDVRQSTMLAASADLSTVAFAEANISNGEFGRYRVSDGNVIEGTTTWFNWEIGVNRNGTQYAVPTYGGTYIYNGSLTQLARLGTYADEFAIGLVYSPIADVVFFAWTDDDHVDTSIDVYDTNTLTKIATVDPSTTRFDSTGNTAFDEGRLKISRDGQWLAATDDSSVILYGPDDFRPAYVSGDVNADGLLDPGERWRYQATGSAISGQYRNTAMVTAKDTGGQTLTATDVSHYLGIAADYGDAPIPYATLVSENGPRHMATLPLMLGAARDTETNGSHAAAAIGDDTTGASDDEDGLVAMSPMQVGAQNVAATVSVSGGPGKLDAWIDFNNDGSWGGPGEQIFSNQVVANGVNNLTFDVPSYALAGVTYARFRISSAGGLGPEGVAADGEVEDYQVPVVAPPPTSGLFGGRNVITSSADGASAVFAADLDGDGDMDVLSGSYNDNQIAWFENNGSQAFTARTISAGALGAAAVFAADVDGDGDLDALSASALDDKIAWYENDGNRNFTARVITSAADGARSVFAADVDGDGDTDVLSASYDDDKIQWYDNDGNQNFTARMVTAAADGARSVFAADLDADGDLDLLSASALDNRIAWYENDGVQNFTPRTIVIDKLGATAVFVSDFDNDGDLDVLAASALDNRVDWYANDGTPGNGGWTTYALPAVTGASSVFAVDMDGDNDVDILATSPVDKKLIRFDNDGTPTNGGWVQYTLSSAVDGASAVFVADLDRDGDLDIVNASQADDKVSWFENVGLDFGDAPAPYAVTLAQNGARHPMMGPLLGLARDRDNNGVHSTSANGDDTAGVPDDEDGVAFGGLKVGRLGASVTVTVTGGPAKLDAWIDFNGDRAWGGPGEQIFASQSVDTGANLLTFDVPNSARAGSVVARFRLSTAGGLGPKGLALDGEVEDYTVTIDPSSVATGEFGPQNVISSGANGAKSVYAADIDGDGDMDIVSASYLDNKVAWYENNGDGAFALHTISTAALRATSVFAIDLDGDGDTDVLSASLGDDRIAWYENNGAQEFTARTISAAANGAVSVFAADVDSDGDLDVLSASTLDDKIAWYENNGAEVFMLRTISTAADGATSVSAADIDGDGDMDVLSSSFSDDKIAWYDNNGAQTFTARTIVTTAEGARSAFAADLDRDGDLDILSASSIDSRIAWYANDGTPGNGGWINNTITTAAEGARSVVAADLDGDGDLDVLSASKLDDKIAWYQNDGFGNFIPYPISEAANGAYSLVAADIDGDGDLDVVSASYTDDKIAWYENPPTLRVLEAAPTTGGAKFTLSELIAVDQLNLYDSSTDGASDVQLTNTAGQSIKGSLVVDPDESGFTLVATEGLLPPDSYTFKLRSSANGFRTKSGELLDGDADGVPGGDYLQSFVVAAPAANAVTVSLPHFARGPQQPVNIPATSALGLPIQVSDGANLTALSFELMFDAELLDVGGITLVGGGSAELTPVGPGRVQIALTFASPLAAGSQTVAYLTANVPVSAASRYGEREVLDIFGLRLTAAGGGNVPGVDQDAVHVNAYFGDLGRNGRYDSFDVQQASRLALRLDAGFERHPLLDPVIISDFNGNRRVDSFDVQQVSRLALRLSADAAPALPSPGPTTTDTDRLTADPPAEAPKQSDPPAEAAQPVDSPRADIDGNGAVDVQDVAWAVYYFSRSENGAASADARVKKLDLNNDGLFDAADVLWAITDFKAGLSAEGESSPALSATDSDFDSLADDAFAAKKKKSR